MKSPGQSKDGVLVAASNLPEFKNVPLSSLISKNFGHIPVLLVNDGDTTLSTEIWGNETKIRYKNVKNVVMVVIGTGIGIGVLINGNLYQGNNSLIEAGHMIINSSSDSIRCGCGQRGCIEVYASGPSITKRMAEEDIKEKIFSDINTKYSDAQTVFERASNNDTAASKVIDETAESLAIFCINISRVLDPEMIIFGGGVSRSGDFLLDKVRSYIQKLSWTCLCKDIDLRVAGSSGSSGGVLGAALLVRRLVEKGDSDLPDLRTDILEELKDTSVRPSDVCVAAIRRGSAVAVRYGVGDEDGSGPVLDTSNAAVRQLSSILSADVVETQDGYCLTVDMPGVRPSDLELVIAAGVVRVRAERRCDIADSAVLFNHKIERSTGKLERSVILPIGADATSAQARLEIGVLSVWLNKTGGSSS